MSEVWMLDYLHAVFPMWGVFESEEAAWEWVDLHDPKRKELYKAFSVSVNTSLVYSAPTTCTERRYANQR